MLANAIYFSLFANKISSLAMISSVPTFGLVTAGRFYAASRLWSGPRKGPGL